MMFHQITQPGRREDVQLLGEWLQQSMHRNQYENSDGHFEDTEAVFLLHSIAFLEIVRQVMNAKFLCNVFISLSDLLIKLFFFHSIMLLQIHMRTIQGHNHEIGIC